MTQLSQCTSEDICMSSAYSLVKLSMESSKRSLIKDEKKLIGVLYVVHSLSVTDLISQGKIKWD